MTLYSIAEDLSQRTLAAISGTCSQLCYLAGLRDPNGRYRHWGLERSYGADRAHTAICHAHQESFLELLRCPLRQLVSEADDSVLGRAPSDLVPADMRGGSARHFASVLHALQALREERRELGKRHER